MVFMNFESLKQLLLETAQSADADKCLELMKTYNTLSSEMFEVSNKNGDTIVHLAAKSGSTAIIRLCFLHYGLDILIQRNKDGKMPLHVAAHSGQLQCVEYLLSRNVPVDALKRSDWTPLMLACTKGDLNIVKALIKYEANLTYRNKDGWTAFHIAAREGCVDVVKYLLKIDKMLWRTQSKNSRTPLHTAALHGNIEVVRLLLSDTDQPIDPVDCCGISPLMDAISSCHNEVFQILVDKGASVHKTDRLGRNLLHLAAEAGNVEVCTYLINVCHLNINSKSIHGLTALHFAVKEKSILCIQKLLEFEADKTIQDCKGRTALDYTTDEAICALLNSSYGDVLLKK